MNRHETIATLSPAVLLDTWEAGARRHPIDRAVLLLTLAGCAPEAAADMPLGRRNRAIMALHRGQLSLWADCTGCGERMSVEIAPEDLPEGTDATVIEVAGHRFRAPTSRDLAALVGGTDPRAAALALATACALEPEALPEGAALDALLAQVEAALDAGDPWAELTLTAECPACGQPQRAALDVPGLVWDEIAAAAGRLVDEVHALAGAYGWAERDILAMGAARRAAYLGRVVG